MKLINCNGWKAVHFPDGRTILSQDYYLFCKLDWETLLHDIEVEPTNRPDHYRVTKGENNI